MFWGPFRYPIPRPLPSRGSGLKARPPAAEAGEQAGAFSQRSFTTELAERAARHSSSSFSKPFHSSHRSTKWRRKSARLAGAQPKRAPWGQDRSAGRTARRGHPWVHSSGPRQPRLNRAPPRSCFSSSWSSRSSVKFSSAPGDVALCGRKVLRYGSVSLNLIAFPRPLLCHMARD